MSSPDDAAGEAASSEEGAAAAGPAVTPDGTDQPLDREVVVEPVTADADEVEVLDVPDEELAAAAADVQGDIAALTTERDDYLDALRRLQADFENYKKRSMKQTAEAADRATEDLLTKLLPVLDTVDLARTHGAESEVDKVGGPLLEALAKVGLERIDPAGQPFDPNEADAVLHEDGDGGPTVVDTLRAGWRYKERVLRPAMVKVAG